MTRRKKSKLHLVQKIVLFFNVAASLALFISYLASIVDPRSWWFISFLGLAYPILLLINICFSIYWLVNGFKFTYISFIVILIGWKFLISYIGFRESTAIGVPKSSKKFIRVMTYNVHEFKQFGNKNDRQTKELFLDIIRKEQPDVICFQEFFTRSRSEYNFKRLICETLYTSNYYYKPSKGNSYETMGMAIFSKYPIIDTGIIKFDNRTTNETIFADIKLNNKVFRVYNVHFQSIRFKPEDYEYINEIKKQIGTDIKSSRRIGNLLKQAFIKRSSQVDLVKDHTEKCNFPYLIVGDFNDTPISYTVNKMLSGGLINTFREKGSGFGITYNGSFPNFQIDYILVSPHFSVKNYRIIQKKVSDHYAVRSDLELK